MKILHLDSTHPYLSNELNTMNNVLSAVQETNNNIRRNRDWEKMKGRAVN